MRSPAPDPGGRPDDDLEAVFLELADLGPGDRAARLAGLSPDRRAAVEAMLAGLDAGAWLEAPLLGPSASLAAVFDPERDAAGVEPPAAIGPYQVRRVLGRGGHAVVYLAFQTGELRRPVALKLLLDDGSDGAARARFEFERDTLANLEHRGVPRIYDSGRDGQGRPYFAMELVRGDWITRWCRDRALARRERIELFREALDAVRAAHAAGVVHRDLKPANVMVGETGGRPHVKVIDFGIARGGQVSPAQLAATDAPGLLGSLSTMSPEQVRGGAEAASERSDVFALGAILFELLADRPPRSLRGRALGDVVRDIAEREPPRLAAVASSARGDLDAIVGKAMAFDPRDRYPSVEAFDADLGRWLAGDPILARAPGPLERGLRASGRHRRALAAATVASAVLGAFLWLEWSRAAGIEAMREAGRLDSLLEEESRLRRERGAESERLRLLGEVLDATDPDATTPLDPAERAALRARALVAECEPRLLGGYGEPCVAKLTEAVALRRIEVAARPSDPAALEGLSLALVRLGDSDDPKREKALAIYREAFEIDARLHREHPRIRRFHDNLVWSHDRIGLTHWNLGSIAEARKAYRAMADEARRLVAAHPEPAVSRHTAAHALWIEGCWRAIDGDLDAATATLEEAATEIDEAIRRDPQRIDFHGRRERVQVTLATIDLRRGRTDAALVAADRAASAAEIAGVLGPASPRDEPERAVEARILLAEARLDAGENPEDPGVANLLDEAERRRGQAVLRHGDDSIFPRPFRIELLRGRTAPLERLLDAIERAEPEPTSCPRVELPECQALLVGDLLAAAAWLEPRDPERARRCRAAVRTIIDRVAVEFPDHAGVEEMRGRLALAEGRPDEAARHFDRSLELGQARARLVILAERGTLRAMARAAAKPR